MVSNLSNAMAGKTARACDSCIRKRARWYCAADDAFLCQSCDGSVHSANQLARRHDRVRLKTASVEPPWTTGFTRKARTPRRKTMSDGYIRDPVGDQVPEIGADESTTSYDEMSEEQVMYRVPFIGIGNGNIDDNYMEFGGDVESLLGFDMEELGLVNCGEEESMEGSSGSGRRVKFEEEEEEMDIIVNDQFVDMERETIFEVNFNNYECTRRPLIAMSSEDFEVGNINVKKKVLLALDYEGVIAAWTSERSPWTTGDRPEVDPNDSWLDCMGNSGTIYYPYGDHQMGGQNGDGGGREARVTRYREKRRNRLFSKKIRYEVRKLNAEKRPRMKGRFVKRSNFATPPPPPPAAAAAAAALLNK